MICVSSFFVVLLIPSICLEFTNFSFSVAETYQANDEKLGESAGSAFLKDADAEVAGDECFSTEAPDTCWAVPQIPSTPTASGLHWPMKSIQNPFDACIVGIGR